MIDNLALGITHLLLLVAAWRLVRRADLDREGGEQPRGVVRRKSRPDA